MTQEPKDSMNYLQQAAGYQKAFMKIFPKLSSPKVLIGGPVRISLGFPLKTCGNDVLSGIRPAEFDMNRGAQYD
jgi:hypothetical protein